jgi:hypothetical protein
MAEFLTTQGSSYYVEHIVRNAKKQLVLISPYLQLSPTLVQRLKDADEQNVQITLVCRKDKINPEESDRLRQLKNLAVYCHETIHAKCYFNEDTM